jgi:hypothetical protein
VTLIRQRTYQVLVVREDSAGGFDTATGTAGPLRRGLAKAVDLKAYQNDVLHALSETGGLPGLDAKNEIKILRGAFADAQGRAALLNGMEGGGYDVEDTCKTKNDNPNIVIIPLRVRPTDPPPSYREEDIILTTGDIVFISTREREVYYTGGLLSGREQLLPRDYDLDVLGAIAVANGSIAVAAGSGGGGQGAMFAGGSGSFTNPRGLIPPTEVIVVRTVEGGYQIPIKVNINRAISNPAERILIKPGDLVLLQYTPIELIANIALNNVQINYFLQGNRNGTGAF